MHKNRMGINFEVAENGCFVCTSHKPNSEGYRAIKLKGKSVLMHRFIYEQCYGAIPEGLLIRHACDNRNCINPEHLEPGSHADNNRDMMERGRQRAPRGPLHPKAKLTTLEAFSIYKRATQGENMQHIADEYGLHIGSVFKIKKGINWGYLTPTFKVLSDVERERVRQMELWGVQRHSFGTWLAILVEEIGEVATAIQVYEGLESAKATDAGNLYEELIHAAAVASAFAEQVLEEMRAKGDGTT